MKLKNEEKNEVMVENCVGNGCHFDPFLFVFDIFNTLVQVVVRLQTPRLVPLGL